MGRLLCCRYVPVPDQIPVQRGAGKEFFVRAHENVRAVHHEEAPGAQGRADPVGDDDQAAPAPGEGFLRPGPVFAFLEKNMAADDPRPKRVGMRFNRPVQHLQGKIEFLLCDTAGRMHTKTNLMAELQKVKRTLGKHDPDAPHETLLVVDATTGGNAFSQAREFQSAIGLTGLIVTKLDGSGKGGVIVAIQDQLGIPARFIGTGEKIDDFAPFDASEFVGKML